MKSEILKIREWVEAQLETVDKRQACMQHAWAVYRFLGAPIVAGSASWKFTDYDNGSNPTHVSFEYEQYLAEVAADDLNPIAKELLRANGHPDHVVLPEMHVWNMYKGQTLDISTGSFTKMAELIGEQWTRSLPPEYHFGKAEHKKRTWSYRPNTDATALARECAASLESHYILKGDG